MEPVPGHYPRLATLEPWITPRYWQSFQAGTLRAECFRHDPFPHCVLSDLFRREVYERLQVDCEVQETRSFDLDKASLNQSYVCVPDIVRLIYGPPFRRFLNALTGKSLLRPVSDDATLATALPQVRTYSRGSTGLAIHQDDNLGFDVGMLFYLTPGWHPGRGGETCLYRRVGGLLLEEQVLEPQGNTLVLLFFSEASWHCVREMSGDWTRRNIFVGWQTASAVEPLESRTVEESHAALSAD